MIDLLYFDVLSFTPEQVILFSFSIAVLVVWSLIWKGIALWKAARNESVRWYIALLIINTFGILEILYIFYFSQKKYPAKVE